MSFEFLRLEVMVEFAGLTGRHDREETGYGYQSREGASERLVELNRSLRWRRHLPETRARAVETTRQWRAKQMSDPVTRAVLLAKRREQARRWRANNPAKARRSK